MLAASALTLFLATASGASGAGSDHEGWEVVQAEGDLKIRVREHPQTGLQEVWAEGAIAADVRDVQETLMRGESFARFMPYVKESRAIFKPDPDGGVFTYTRLALPWVSSRDFVTKTWMLQGVKPDGSGVFRNKWIAVPDKLPKRHGVIRLKVNDGSWEVRRHGRAKSWANFRFVVDPGGWIPSAAASFGNTSGVSGTFEAVETEARRRGEERRKKESAAAVKQSPKDLVKQSIGGGR